MQIFTSFTPEVIELLKNGAVGVIPTDTVYGVVTPLFNQVGVERMYELKGREEAKPVGTVLINDPLQVEHIAQSEHLLRASAYWPAPVSVVIPVSSELHYAHKGLDSLPFRVPDHESLQRLLLQTGPLATSSANFAGQMPPTTLQEALGYFREGVDFYVDGGDLSHRKPSAILRFNEEGEPELLRGELK